MVWVASKSIMLVFYRLVNIEFRIFRCLSILPNVKHKLEAWLITWEAVYLFELNDRWSLKNKTYKWILELSSSVDLISLSLIPCRLTDQTLYCSHKCDNHSALHVFRFFVWIWKRAVWKLYFWLDLNDNHPSPKYAGVSDDPEAARP